MEVSRERCGEIGILVQVLVCKEANRYYSAVASPLDGTGRAANSAINGVWSVVAAIRFGVKESTWESTF